MSEAVAIQMNVLSFAKDLNLEVVYEGRKTLTLASMSVERPGLQLAGFFDYFDTRRVLAFGLAEYEYLKSFSSEERKQKLCALFSAGQVPCVILTRDLPAMQELLDAVSLVKCPVFRSEKITTDLMNDLYRYLGSELNMISYPDIIKVDDVTVKITEEEITDVRVASDLDSECRQNQRRFSD